MLWNPGELPLDWTVAKLKGKHPSRPFNPDVANAFFRAGMIEAWGRGIERIMEACRVAATPQQTLLYERTGLWIEFPFPEDRFADAQKAGRITPRNYPEDYPENHGRAYAESVPQPPWDCSRTGQCFREWREIPSGQTKSIWLHPPTRLR